MVTTTLTSHETKSGASGKGPWTLNLFAAADGETYKVFTGPDGIASQAAGLIGQLVDLDIEYKPAKDPRYPADKFITRIVPSAQAPQPTTQIRTTPSVNGNAYDERQAAINRNAGIARAIEAFGIAGVDPLTNLGELFELAETFAEYGATGTKRVPAAAVGGPIV